MNIAIIDAEIIDKKKHRFPNLVCMKLSSYYKKIGDNIELKLTYNNLENYDKVFISKVFTNTKVNQSILDLPNVIYGGTGFLYDKAKPLDCDIEHSKPDYDLYNDWIEECIKNGAKKNEFTYYKDYSIGFTTRGCCRKCSFCVNKNSNSSELHSPIEEFLDINRKYICLQDDNVFACKDWKQIFESLITTKKPFTYRQGMDERFLTDEKSEMLSKSKWQGDIIFAFDNIKEKDIIIEKLKLYYKYNKRVPKFYVFCGYDRENKWNDDFWKQDIINAFERIKILMQNKALVYLTRFERCIDSPYSQTYITLARWCNQPNMFKKKSFREFCEANQERTKTKICADMRGLINIEKNIENISQYLDMKW